MTLLRTRRTLLAGVGTLATALAGCAGSEDGPDEEGNETDGDGSNEGVNETSDDGSTETEDGDSGTTGTAANEWWSSFRGNPRNTGSGESTVPTDEPAVRWRYPVDGSVGTTAALVDGTAFVAAGTSVHAIDAADGERRWRTDVGAEVTGSPAVGADAIVVPAGDRLVVLERDGTERHRVDVAGSAPGPASIARRQSADSGDGASPTVVDGTAYHAVDGGDAVAVSLADGSVTWRESAGDASGNALAAVQKETRSERAARASPAVADGIVYVGTDSAIVARDAADGSERWRHPIESPATWSPAVADGAVFAGSDDPVALETADGEVRWTGNTETLASASSATRQEIAPYEPSIAVADGLAVGRRSDGRLAAYDVADGTVRWETSPAARSAAARDAGQLAPSWSSPAIADGTVVVGTADGVAAVSLEAGESRWYRGTDARVTASPAIANGLIVVGDGSGTVWALES